MNKSANIPLPMWRITSRWKRNFGSWDINDILSWFLQIPLQTLILLGALLLSVQVVWRKLFSFDQGKNASAHEHLKNLSLRNFTIEELRQYDGVQDSRIYVAVNAKVFDVTKTKGTRYLDGAFSAFAGRDASRALATFSLERELVESNLSEPDKLLDLNPLQLDSLLDWEMQYLDRHPCIGKLVKSHEPSSLQQACLSTVRAVMGRNLCDEKMVETLPLPKKVRQGILAYGKE